MDHPALQQVLAQIRKLTSTSVLDELTDGALVERFVQNEDESAFAALVRRHGPMVLGVCRNLLRDPHDAEDAFQATFLVLVRRARALERRPFLGAWLHGVAQRTALKARAARGRWAQERQVAVVPSNEPTEPGDNPDLRPILTEELNRLPEKYRAPLVLCYLQGKSTEEAARHVGCPRGTVLSRLSRGRDLLRGRLARRGLAVTAVALDVSLAGNASAAVAAPLFDATVKAGVLTLLGKMDATPAAALAEAVTRGMFMMKLKMVSVVAGLVCVIALGGVAAAVAGRASPRLPVPQPPAAPLAAFVADPVEAGPADPLPEGALARFGTLRLRGIGPASAQAFSPDGKKLLSLHSGLRVWDTTTGKVVRELGKYLKTAAYSPNGKYIAGGDDFRVFIWDAETGKQIHELKSEERLVTIAFSPDSATLAAGGSAYSVQLWDLNTGKLDRKHKFESRNTPAVTAVAFSPDGGQLMIGAGDRLGRLWDVKSGKTVREFPSDMYATHAVAFGPDGKSVAAASGRQISLYDPASGKLQRNIVAPGMPQCLAFSPDSRLLAAADTNGSSMAWSTGSGEEVFKSIGGTYMHSVAFSPDGKLLATGSGMRLQLWDVEARKPKLNFPDHPGTVQTVLLSHDGKTLATVSTDKVIRLWDAATGARRLEIQPVHSVNSLAFSPDDKRLAAGMSDPPAHNESVGGTRAARVLRCGFVSIWDTASGKELHRAENVHCASVQAIAFSPDSKRLATGDNSGNTIVWDAETGKSDRTFPSDNEQFHSMWALAFSADGKRLVSTGSVFLRVWNPTTGEKVFEQLKRPTTDHALHFLSADGSLLGCAVATTSKVHFYDTTTGRERQVLEIPRSRPRGGVPASTAVLSVDGKTLAAPASDGTTIQLWDIATGKEIGTIAGHGGVIHSIAFANDGRRLVTGSSDTTALIWDLSKVGAGK